MKRGLIVGALCALLFVGGKFHIRTMAVTYIHEPTQSVSLVDCDGEGFVVFADDIAENDLLYCLCYGSGAETMILNYVKR